VHEKIDGAELIAGGGEEFFDALIAAHVAGLQPFVGEAAFFHRLADAPLHFFDGEEAESAARPLLDAVGGDVPGDAAVVGDIEDQSRFSVENTHGGRLAAITSRDKAARSTEISATDGAQMHTDQKELSVYICVHLWQKIPALFSHATAEMFATDGHRCTRIRKSYLCISVFICG
jgi:hypothetical protein